MDAAVVNRSEFWQTLFQASQITAELGPVLLLVASLVWLWRWRSGPALVGAIGSLLVLTGVLFHHVGGSMTSVGMPYPQPMPGGSSIRFFLVFYSINFGYLMLGVGVLWHFCRKT